MAEDSSRRSFLKKLGWGTVAVLGAGKLVTILGCVTHKLSENDFSTVSRSRGDSAFAAATQPVETPSDLGPKDQLSPEEKQQVVRTYEGIPPQNVGLYISSSASVLALQQGSGKPVGLEARVLNTTGQLYPCADELYAIEHSLPMTSLKPRLIIGPNADRDDASARSAAQRIGRDDGIFGIDAYTTQDRARFLLEICEVTGLSAKLRNQRQYNVKVTFGTPAFQVIKARTDIVYVLETAENGGLGYLVAGPAGAAGAAADSLIDGAWAYFEGLKAPRGTIWSDNRSIISSLPERQADVWNILGQSKAYGARNLIVYQYDGGTGVVYTGPISGAARADGNSIYFTATEEGVCHLKALLLRALKVGTRVNCHECHDQEKLIIERCAPHGGGRNGGAGGDGHRSNNPGGL